MTRLDELKAEHPEWRWTADDFQTGSGYVSGHALYEQVSALEAALRLSEDMVMELKQKVESWRAVASRESDIAAKSEKAVQELSSKLSESEAARRKLEEAAGELLGELTEWDDEEEAETSESAKARNRVVKAYRRLKVAANNEGRK